MMATNVLMLLMSLLAGLLLGAVFFVGLWWTIIQAAASPRPALWFMSSALLRTGQVLAGFYLVAGAQWPCILLCMGGFILARVLVLRCTRAVPVVVYIPGASNAP